MAAKSNGECFLRWTDHESLLQGVCNSLLTTEKFADVTIYCDGMSLKCHKFILSACSTYFDQILSDSPSDHPIIVLKDVPYWQMQALLHFVYKGELVIDETKLSSLVELAQTLHIKGIGEFGSPIEEAPLEAACSQSPKKPEVATEANNQMKDVKDYLSLEGNVNSLSERLMSLAHESQQILSASLSASIETSDYSLQETEVEYNFQSEPLDDGENIDQPILVEYTSEESNIHSCRRKKRPAESEAEASSDASVSALAMNPIYKRYSEENLLAAIRAVLEDGAKQVDAGVKYGIPFTTLTRKIRMYREYGGRLPRCPSKRKERDPEKVSSLASVLSIDNELDATVNNDNAALEADERVAVQLILPEPGPDAVPAVNSVTFPAFKQYKTYTEENLKAAISAVLYGGARLQDASHRYKIPLTTLTRKIRSSSKPAQREQKEQQAAGAHPS